MNLCRSAPILCAAAACSISLVLAGGARAAGITLSVSNDGVDSATCGAKSAPCRSISQAIENASDGDAIEVGAGHYGNVSGAGDYSGAGDEHPQMTGLYDFPGCVVCITKALAIYSLHGAAVTVIEAIPSTPYTATVMLLHDGVTFGRQGGGFTLAGGNTGGVVIDQDTPHSDFGILLKHNITIAGNIDLADQTGFVFQGLEFMDDPCPSVDCAPTAQIAMSDNESINNASSGFSITVNAYHGGQITLQNNLVQGAGTGFAVAAGIQNEAGDAISAAGTVLMNDVAVHCGYGFNADAPGNMTSNTAAANSQVGFLVVPGGGAFLDNSAIGNAGPGVVVQFSVDGFDTQPTRSFQSFADNNFYGNDRNRPALTFAPANFGAPGGPYNPGASAHCGVLNLGALAATAGPQAGGVPPIIKLAATNNFWGSRSGPAPSGTGDAAGGACDQIGGMTVAKPFAASPFGITAWP